MQSTHVPACGISLSHFNRCRAEHFFHRIFYHIPLQQLSTNTTSLYQPIQCEAKRYSHNRKDPNSSNIELFFLVFWAEDISFTSLHPFLSGGGSESFCHKYKRPSQPVCTLSRQPAWHSNWGNYPQTSYPLMHPRRYRLAFNGGYLSQLLGKHSIDISPQTTFKFFAFLSQTKQ